MKSIKTILATAAGAALLAGCAAGPYDYYDYGTGTAYYDDPAYGYYGGPAYYGAPTVGFGLAFSDYDRRDWRDRREWRREHWHDRGDWRDRDRDHDHDRRDRDGR